MKYFAYLAATAALACAAGCFGDNTAGGDPPADGGDPRITSVEAPAQGVDAEGGRTQLLLHLKGERDEQLTVAVTATLGVVTPEQHVVITDGNGEATHAPEFVAGDVAGDAMVVANVANLGGERASFELSFPVVALSRVGEVAQLPNTSTIPPNFLEGQSITLAAPGKLRRVGIVAAGAADVVVGIYSDVAGEPAALLASASATLRQGVNELPVAEVMLPAGTYWFMTNYRLMPSLYRSSTMRPLKYVSRTFSTALPATYPAIHTDTTEPQRNCYLVLGR